MKDFFDWEALYNYSFLPSMIELEFKNRNRKTVPTPRKIIFNDPATIVYWEDGTKTVVKASTQCGDNFDEEVGLAMAYMNKIFGGRSKFLKMVREVKKESYEA